MTAQNYAQGNYYASTPTPDPATGRQVVRYSIRQQIEILNWLYETGRLTKSQYQYGEVVPVLNDAMAPQLCVGGSVVMQWIEQNDDLTLRLGKVVALRLVDEQDNDELYYVGRLSRVDQSQIVLTHDNQAFGELVLDRQQVDLVYDVVAGFAMPVL